MHNRLIAAVSALALLSPAAFAQLDAGASGAATAGTEAQVETGTGLDAGADVGLGADADADAGATTGDDAAATAGAGTAVDTESDMTTGIEGDVATGSGTGIELDGDAAAGVAAGILAELSADELVGMPVQTAEGAPVGEIAEVTEGAEQQVLVSTGGFLGIGAKTVAVDPAVLSFNAEAEAVVVNMTEAELEALPAYEG